MVEKIGTYGNDFLEGTDGDDMLRGVSGNDTLVGYLESDVQDPRTGGQNSVDGGAGGDGDDRVIGGTGEHMLLRPRTLDGGADNDQITLSGSSTTTGTAYGGNGNDNLSYVRGGKQGILRGGAGNDMPNAGYRATVTLDGGDDVGSSSSSYRSRSGEETMIFDDRTDNTFEFPVSRPILVDGEYTEGFYEVSPSRSPLHACTMDYTSIDGSADGCKDNLATSGTLTRGTGQSTPSVSVPVNGDTDIGPKDLLKAHFNAPAEVVANSVGSVELLNDGAGLVHASALGLYLVRRSKAAFCKFGNKKFALWQASFEGV